MVEAQSPISRKSRSSGNDFPATVQASRGYRGRGRIVAAAALVAVILCPAADGAVPALTYPSMKATRVVDHAGEGEPAVSHMLLSALAMIAVIALKRSARF